MLSKIHFKISNDYFAQYVENYIKDFRVPLIVQVISGQSLCVSTLCHVKGVEPN